MEGISISASGPVFSHLLFVYDTLLFLTTSKQNYRNLSTLLHGHCNASGQQVSLQKSVVYFGANVPSQLALELSNMLNMQKVDDMGKYLGIPTI